MAISFELKSKDDSYFFTGLDAKGELLLNSAQFASKEEAERAIQDVRVGSMMSQNIAVGDDSSGEKYFAIKNQAGQVLVKSVLFASDLVFNNALHSVRESACIAKVNDLT